MNPKFADDRLTAFLDGTLSAEETAEIRQEINRNHEVRCLVEELRQARSELQALPRQKVSAGFAQRVMAQVANVQMELPATTVQKAEPTVSLPQAKSTSSLQAFILGVTAASIVGLVVWAGFLRDGSQPIVAENPTNGGGQGNIVQPVAGEHGGPVLVPAVGGDRKLTLAQLGEALQEDKSPGQVYLLRVTVSNNLLLRGEFDEQLAQHGLTVRGSMNDRPALRSATEAIEKLEPITTQTMRLPVDEVFVLDGTAEQLAAALPVWTEQPADVASAMDEVLAVSPGERAFIADPALDKVAVRIGRKQLYRAMGIDVAQGESGPNPEGSSEVLVVIRVK